MELKDLSPTQLAELQNTVSKALASMVKDEQDALLLITNEIEGLNKKVAELRALEVTQVYPESNKTWDERQVLQKSIKVLESKTTNIENTIKCLENGGMLSEVTDKKGKEHHKIPDFRKIDTNQIYFDNDTILTDKQPLYVPKINEEEFRQRGYVFDAIRLAVDSYILAIKKHSEKEPTDYVLVTLDQLVLISDYYYTKAKATLLKDAKDSTARQEAYWNAKPDTWKENTVMQRNYYNALPVKLQKEISRADFEVLDWREREKIYKHYKRYSSKRITSKLSSTEMFTSFHRMYERFIDPLAVITPRGFANPDVSIYWRKFSEMMNYKMNDIEIQRDDLSEMRKAAIETSFGESNTNDTLQKNYGILVKRQNGDKINPIEIEQIKEAFISVQQKFGNLKEISLTKNIKISHTGVRYVFSSKAMGMYVPSMGTIAVSDKYGDTMFKIILAHEYAHFIDNYIGELSGKRYSTDDYENTAGKIAFLFRDNMNKPKQKHTKYTNATKECFARAFEQFYGVETFGEDAGISFSDKPLDKFTTFFSADDFVNKTIYENQLKPLILQFFTENADIFKYGIDVNEINEPVAINNENTEPNTELAEAITALELLLELSDDKEEIMEVINKLKGGKKELEQDEIPVMDEETYLSINNVGRQGFGDSALHKNKGNNSDKMWSKIVDRQAQKDTELAKRRQELREEYAQKIEKGELRQPTRLEKLIATANGHEDNESVQAARRILEKQGVSWKQLKNGGEVKKERPFNRQLIDEMLIHLDTKGEHSLVYKYKGITTDENISRIIQAWATSKKSLQIIADGIEERENKYRNVKKDGGEVKTQNDLYNEWTNLVNMTKTELEEFKKTDEGKKAGLTKNKAKQLGISSGQESSEWILKMKATDVQNWTPAMWKWAKKQTAFIKRMNGVDGELYDEKGNKTRKHTSLLIWGHNPEKESPPPIAIGVNSQFTKKTKKKAEGGELDNSKKKVNFTEQLIKGEIKNDITRESNISKTKAIQSAADFLRKSESTNRITQETKNIKQQEKEFLIPYIKENNLWVDSTVFTNFLDAGCEQDVYFVGNEKVVKFNDAIFYNSWQDYFHSLLLHNYYFPDTAYKLLGFTEKENTLFAVVEQIYVDTTEKTNLEDVVKIMLETGFEVIKNNDYINKELGIIIEDLHDENVLTKNGVLYFIDTVFYIKKAPEFTAKAEFYFEYVPLHEIEKYKEFDRETEVRFNKSELNDLTKIIKEKGITYPITLMVYNNYGVIPEGNHRIAAAKRLGIKNIPVKVEVRTKPFKGTIYENKVVKLPRKKDINELKVWYPEIKLLDIDNSAAYYGFTKSN